MTLKSSRRMKTEEVIVASSGASSLRHRGLKRYLDVGMTVHDKRLQQNAAVQERLEEALATFR